MRALRRDEIDYILGIYILGISPLSRYYADLNKKSKRAKLGVERRLRNLGLLKVEVPRIPGYQETLYQFTKKGAEVFDELNRAYAVKDKVQELKDFVNRRIK